jgi:hypothetical protein
MRFARAGAAVLALAAAGCAPPVGHIAPAIRQMGEHVEAGSLIYTVMETEWLDQLGPDIAPRLPEHRFLEVRILVTNSGIGTAYIPEAALLGGNRTYPELTSGHGVRDWLGLLRTAGPADTVGGRLLFDVPFGNYVLRVGECNNPDDIKTALVAIPLDLPAPVVSFFSGGRPGGVPADLLPELQAVPGGIE